MVLLPEQQLRLDLHLRFGLHVGISAGRVRDYRFPCEHRIRNRIFLLGFPSAGSASEPDKSAGLMHYFAVYFNDSFRVSTTWDPTLPQTALVSATGLPIQGGLVRQASRSHSRMPAPICSRLILRSAMAALGFLARA